MTLKRYRKKPVTVTAVQWTGDNLEEVRELTGREFFRTYDSKRTEEQVEGDDGSITAMVYDYLHSTWVGVKTGQHVIKGVKGEFYPCDDDVLQATYDPA